MTKKSKKAIASAMAIIKRECDKYETSDHCRNCPMEDVCDELIYANQPSRPFQWSIDNGGDENGEC